MQEHVQVVASGDAVSHSGERLGGAPAAALRPLVDLDRVCVKVDIILQVTLVWA